MRTLKILTLVVFWGCFFVTSSSQIDEETDLENRSDEESDTKDNYSIITDDDDDNEKFGDIYVDADEDANEDANEYVDEDADEDVDEDADQDADEEDKPLKGDEIDDTSDAEISLEVTTPYNFLRYSLQTEHIQKYPRFAILRRNRQQIIDNTFYDSLILTC